MKSPLLLAILFCLTLSSAALGEVNCTNIKAAMQTAEQNVSGAIEQTYGEIIEKPDMSVLQECIGGIMNPSLNLDFGLGLPSLSGAFEAGCARLKSVVGGIARDKFRQLNQELSIEAFEGLMGTSGSGSISPNGNGGVNTSTGVKDSSHKIVDSIWDAIK